jgi:hypothetical protein
MAAAAAAGATTGMINSKVEAAAEMATPLTPQGVTTRIAAGRTPPGNTNWIQGSSPSEIYVVVDTSQAKFMGTPIYVASLSGMGGMFTTSGGSYIYAATSTSFTVYVKSLNGSPLNPSLIKVSPYGWFVNWHGIEM